MGRLIRSPLPSSPPGNCAKPVAPQALRSAVRHLTDCRSGQAGLPAAHRSGLAVGRECWSEILNLQSWIPRQRLAGAAGGTEGRPSPLGRGWAASGVFTSRRGPGLRPPTRRQKAALGRRAKGDGCSGRTARSGPPPVAWAEGGPQAGEGPVLARPFRQIGTVSLRDIANPKGRGSAPARVPHPLLLPLPQRAGEGGRGVARIRRLTD
jgi:hypothetical protein